MLFPLMCVTSRLSLLRLSDGTAQLLNQLAQSEFHKGQRIRFPFPTDPTREKVREHAHTSGVAIVCVHMCVCCATLIGADAQDCPAHPCHQRAPCCWAVWSLRQLCRLTAMVSLIAYA